MNESQLRVHSDVVGTLGTFNVHPTRMISSGSPVFSPRHNSIGRMSPAI